MYTHSMYASRLKRYMVVLMGVWHPYKAASTLLWKAMSHTLFGPFYHHIVPEHKFQRTARHVQITYFFTLLRLAYPHIRQALEDALQDEAVDDIHKAHLRNLKLVLCNYIPVVCVL
jgi:hypothetical protein